MKSRILMNCVMAALVAALVMTAACAKKTIVTEPATVQSQEQVNAEETARLAAEEAARINAEKIREEMAAQKALEAKYAAAKDRFVNQDIHFEYDSSSLTSMAKVLLAEKAAWLKANPSAMITIEGHCDDRGTIEYNLALGERRATAAKIYMVNLGVSSNRMATISYGEEKPVDTAKTEAAYQKNRRAHFMIN